MVMASLSKPRRFAFAIGLMSGTYVKSRTARGTVRAYVPPRLPPDPPLNLDLLRPELNRGDQELARLEAFVRRLPDPGVFSDLLLLENETAPWWTASDSSEPSDQVGALRHGLRRIAEGSPLSVELLKEMHAVLLKGTPETEKYPGQIRSQQNFVGKNYFGNVPFIPPPPDYLPECLGNLDQFLQDSQSRLPILIQAGLAYAQFQLIHPFADGNGRLGRLLVTLFLYVKRCARAPLICLKRYFAVHQERYDNLLQRIRLESAWDDWLAFFLDATEATARQAMDLALEIVAIVSPSNNENATHEPVDEIREGLKDTRTLNVSSGLLPHRPRFLKEVVVIPMEGAIAFDGAVPTSVLRGYPWVHLVPRLAPLMDGSRTLEELEAGLPDVPLAHLRAAILLLRLRGLVDEETTYPADSIGTGDALAFLRRYAGATAANRNGWEAYERLRATEVLVFCPRGTGSDVELLKSALESSGIGRVIVIERKSLESWRPYESETQPFVASLCLGPEDYEWQTMLNTWCSKHRLCWLRAVVDVKANYADIGPIFNIEGGSCYQCFRALHSRPPSPEGACAEVPSIDAQFWIGMVALEIIYRVSRIGVFTGRKEFKRYELAQENCLQLVCGRVPGCLCCQPLEDCSRSAVISGGPIDTALLFDNYVAREMGAPVLPRLRADQNHISLGLQHEVKQLPNSRQWILNPRIPQIEKRGLDVLQSDGMTSAETLTADELAAVLLLTAGIRGSDSSGMVRRWSPTAGNLGSVELFLAVHEVSGLAPGYYFYQPHEHSLARLEGRAGKIPVEEFMRRVTGDEGQYPPSVLLLLTGALHRVARKYGPFGYKLINLDAGAAVSQLHLIANCLGIETQTAVRWADDLIEQEMNLEPSEEQPTAVVRLSRKPKGRCSLSDANRSEAPGNGCAGLTKKAAYYFEVPIDRVLELLRSESRLRECELQLMPFEVSTEPLPSSDRPVAIQFLPPPASGGRLVRDIIAERTSVRHYSGRAVSVEQLSTMLYCAYRADCNEWPEEHGERESLIFLVLAWRVEGLPPGVYEYEPNDHGLRPLRSLPSEKHRAELFVQSEFVYAPVFVWIAGNLVRACARHGAFGYRLLLLRAGAAGHQLSIAASAMALSGSLVAGLVPDAARLHLGLDVYRQASMIGFAAGYSAHAEGATSFLEASP